MANTHHLTNRKMLLATVLITASIFQQLFSILRQHCLGIDTHSGMYDHREPVA